MLLVGDVYFKSGIMLPLKIDKNNLQMFVPLVCLHSLTKFPTMSEENHEKILRGQLVSIKTHNNIQRLESWLKLILQFFLNTSFH